VEFVKRVAALIPPARKHVVRYYRALGPCSPLRGAVSAVGRAWSACMRKVFEIDPVRCVKCGGEMKLVAVILDDGELDRILAHQGWPTEFPETRPSRAPPVRGPIAEEESQIDPREGKWEGRGDEAEDAPA